MFATRFTRYDGRTESYVYPTRAEAEAHLALFEDDDSGLYRNIAVIDDTNTVLTILPFANGKPETTLRVGDHVKYRDTWATPEERKYVFAIRNINELTENVVIACLNSQLTLTPTEGAKLYMIELVR